MGAFPYRFLPRRERAMPRLGFGAYLKRPPAPSQTAGSFSVDRRSPSQTPAACSSRARSALMRNWIAVDDGLHGFDRTLLALTFNWCVIDPETGRPSQQASDD